MAFIDAHATEVAAAVLTAPAFLSGLSPTELGIVKGLIEARANPEIAAAKRATTRALSETEAGWRSAATQIRSRAGLGKLPHDGAEKSFASRRDGRRGLGAQSLRVQTYRAPQEPVVPKALPAPPTRAHLIHIGISENR
jgi:hypothetical protein